MRKNKAALDKAKANLESENAELDLELKQMSTARNESERKRKQLDNQLLDLQARYSETDRNKGDLLEKSNALQVRHLMSLLLLFVFLVSHVPICTVKIVHCCLAGHLVYSTPGVVTSTSMAVTLFLVHARSTSLQ